MASMNTTCSHTWCGIMLAAAALAGYGAYYFTAQKHHEMPPAVHLDKAAQLTTAMRKLWADHVIWTRDYIIAAVAQAGDQKIAAERLLKNQDDIGAAVIPFYGDAAGKKLAALLRDHILIAADLVEAARTNKQESVTTLNEKWKQNARDIAEFLSSANSHWPQEAMTTMLYEHLSLTIEETKARIAQDWHRDVESFDKIFDQALGMADELAAGIIQQFPEKFA